MRRLDVERGVASPPRCIDRAGEVQETRSSGQYDPCGEQGRRTTPEGIPDNGEHGHGPKIATVERREASVLVAENARRLS
jgi:hypothetical protein